MKVFIQKAVDDLFLKTKAVWVSSKRDARVFRNCADAIDFCVEAGLKDIRLCLSFGDSKYDMHLDVFRAETKALARFNRDLEAQQRLLKQKLDGTVAAQEFGERKKQAPFARKMPLQKPRRFNESAGQPGEKI